MWWRKKKVETPEPPKPKKLLCKLRVQVQSGEHVDVKGTNWNVQNNGCLVVNNDTGGVAIFYKWDYIQLLETENEPQK